MRRGPPAKGARAPRTPLAGKAARTAAALTGGIQGPRSSRTRRIKPLAIRFALLRQPLQAAPSSACGVAPNACSEPSRAGAEAPAPASGDATRTASEPVDADIGRPVSPAGASVAWFASASWLTSDDVAGLRRLRRLPALAVSAWAAARDAASARSLMTSPLRIAPLTTGPPATGPLTTRPLTTGLAVTWSWPPIGSASTG